MKCHAIVMIRPGKGVRCRHDAVKDTKFCYQHMPVLEKERIPVPPRRRGVR